MKVSKKGTSSAKKVSSSKARAKSTVSRSAKISAPRTAKKVISQVRSEKETMKKEPTLAKKAPSSPVLKPKIQTAEGWRRSILRSREKI